METQIKIDLDLSKGNSLYNGCLLRARHGREKKLRLITPEEEAEMFIQLNLSFIFEKALEELPPSNSRPVVQIITADQPSFVYHLVRDWIAIGADRGLVNKIIVVTNSLTGAEKTVDLGFAINQFKRIKFGGSQPPLRLSYPAARKICQATGN